MHKIHTIWYKMSVKEKKVANNRKSFEQHSHHKDELLLLHNFPQVPNEKWPLLAHHSRTYHNMTNEEEC